MTGPRYTPEEDAVIAEVYPARGSKACAEILGRSQVSCANRAKRLGIRSKRSADRSHRWSTDDSRLAVAMLLRVSRQTGRTPTAVIRHLDWLIRKKQQNDAIVARMREGE